jgi:cytoskeleton protein RodZ
MTERQTDQQPQVVETATPLSVGTVLREARERMGLSVSDVVNRLKFAPRQIKALEQDDFGQLPEAAFVRGFVRSYARLLKIDEAPLLAALPDAHAHDAAATQQQAVEVPFPGVYSVRKSNIVWLVAALLVALVLGVFTWWHARKPAAAPARRVATVVQPVALPPVSAVMAAPVISAASAAAATADVAARPKVKFHTSAGAGLIRMTFDEDSWVEVKDHDGKLLMSQVNPAGSEQSIDGAPPFTLTIGHAGGVKLYYKGKPVDLAPSTNVDVAHVTLE